MKHLHAKSAIAGILTFAALGACSHSEAATSGDHAPTVDRAVAQLVPVGESGVRGTVSFAATDDGVRIRGSIEGLTPGAHGFHVHEFGDVTGPSDGKSAGGHFAPRGHDHGRPGDEERHVGDLGNITAGDDGTARIDLVDPVLSLDGARSIVGRSLVVHAGPDTFGQPSGDAGARVAFGVIGIAAKD